MDVKKKPLSNEYWLWIKYRLAQVGYRTWLSLAVKHKYHVSAFTLVKNYAFPNVEKIIANTIGMTPQDLFPNRYSVDGTPIGRKYPRDVRLSDRKKIRNGKDKRGKNHKEQEK